MRRMLLFVPAALLVASVVSAQEPVKPVQVAAAEAALRLQVAQLEQQLAALKAQPDPAAEPAPTAAVSSLEALEARIEELERELAALRLQQHPVHDPHPREPQD